MQAELNAQSSGSVGQGRKCVALIGWVVVQLLRDYTAVNKPKDRTVDSHFFLESRIQPSGSLFLNLFLFLVCLSLLQ
jgi:hypothetical protein